MVVGNWTKEELQNGQNEIRDIFNGDYGFLNRTGAELCCQRKLLTSLLGRLVEICFDEKDLLTKEVYSHRGLASLATEAKDALEKCK